MSTNIFNFGLFNGIIIIWIVIALASIVLSSGALLSTVRPIYSIDNLTSANRNNSNDNSNKTSISVQNYDNLKSCATDQHTPTNGTSYLTHFSCGHVTILKNGTTIREFTLISKENVVIPISNTGLTFSAWTYNESIPGPTMRMTEGDHVQITLINSKDSIHEHSIHMHSIHPASMDGVPGASGDSGQVRPGGSYTYKFVAQPFGVYPYHCHVDPVDQHINNGLYGMLIIDPKIPRPKMTEMVMLMNGYDLNYTKQGVDRIPTVQELKSGLPDFKHNNQVYTVNGVAFEYKDHPIHLITGEHYRIYLVNMLEFDPLNNFHIHGNLFNYYPSGTSLIPDYKSDIVSLMQGDRGILEVTYSFPGMYMFHAHKTEFTMKGWMGMFDVTKPNGIGWGIVTNVAKIPTPLHKPIPNFTPPGLEGM
ncbi:MAG: multicopper oxidase domain-containing protein [Thermoproteota archaeon]|nr:multicopper oxidase domain-containing protein [Thermoproteota archaeon]